MKHIKPSHNVLFNPPLRIFTSENAGAAPEASPSATTRFARPKLQRLVRRDRVARHFTRRGFSFGSSLG